MDREYGVLYIPPTPRTVNAQNGRFMKGHVPHNKGKKWDEYMGKRAQKKAKKGWENLAKFRPKTRPDNAVRCSKPVIAIFEDGRFKPYGSVSIAAKQSGASSRNISRCCILNASKCLNKYTGKINTDHKCNGIRWYFDDDVDIWTQKIHY